MVNCLGDGLVGLVGLIGWLVGWLDGLVGLIGWLACRLVDWLVG